ncbi:unannotated protein [freshwater metagenome]|uniref:Unannotated protein n=1 Tax=freshwater metagenome TaxID=449393 RepID=A0A6J6BSJ3_9ZZZZ
MTSVARCITFAKCRTKGDSGTFVEEQNGSRASATERTAYSCSSKSFEERASEAASARSFSSSPVLEIVPASTRDVTMPRDRRSNSSGVAPTSPSTANVHVDGYSSASFLRIVRGSISVADVAIKSRANTTLSTSDFPIRFIASATRSFHASVLRLPSLKVNCPDGNVSAVSRSTGCEVSPTHVIQDCEARCPTTICGITRTDSSLRSKEKDVKRTGPVPLP